MLWCAAPCHDSETDLEMIMDPRIIDVLHTVDDWSSGKSDETGRSCVGILRDPSWLQRNGQCEFRILEHPSWRKTQVSFLDASLGAGW